MGVSYKVVDAMENTELANKYGVQSVPTLVTDPYDPSSAITGVSQIIGWAKANGQRA